MSKFIIKRADGWFVSSFRSSAYTTQPQNAGVYAIKQAAEAVADFIAFSTGKQCFVLDMEDNKVIEQMIVQIAVDCILKAGYSIQVCDGEDYTTGQLTDSAAIVTAAFDTGTDVVHLSAFDKIGFMGRVVLIIGNGADIISDCSTSVDELIQPAIDYACSL